MLCLTLHCMTRLFEDLPAELNAVSADDLLEWSVLPVLAFCAVGGRVVRVPRVGVAGSVSWIPSWPSGCESVHH